MSSYLIHWRHPKHGDAACDRTGRIPYWALDARPNQVSCSRCRRAIERLAKKTTT